MSGDLRQATAEIAATLTVLRSGGVAPARPLYVAGVIDRLRGSPATADAWLRQAEEQVSGDASLHWQIVAERGFTAVDARRFAEAVPLFERAMSMARRLGISEMPATVDLAAGHRRALAAAGRTASAP